MSEISSWVISIAGICLLSVLIDLCLPTGKTNSVIKNVCSYVLVLVVLLPLPSLLKSNFSLEDVFNEYEFKIQDEYIYNVNQAKLDTWTFNINEELKQKGIHGAVVTISANIFEIDMNIDAVYVDLYNVVISEYLQNINIKTEVKSVVLNN